MDSASEDHLSTVHPELARRVRLLAAKCDANGIVIRVSQGLRTWDQQNLLYAQGRTDGGKVVTNAKGGYSAHNFGYAVDIVPGQAGFPVFTPDWNGMDFRWQQVLMLGKQCHLAEGAEWRTFPDRPHLYPEECPANPDDNLRYIFREAGMDAVWDELKIQEAA